MLPAPCKQAPTPWLDPQGSSIQTQVQQLPAQPAPTALVQAHPRALCMISMAGRQRRCPPHPLVLLGLLLLTRCSTAQPPMSPGSALGSSAPDSPCHTAPQLCSRLRTSISLQLAAHRDAAASGLLDIADNGDGGVTDHDLTDGGAGGGAAAGQDGQSPSPSPSSSLQASLLEGLGELVAARTATVRSEGHRGEQHSLNFPCQPCS